MAGRLRYAQVDLNLFGDPKVRRLFRRLDDERDAYAAMGIWLDILLASWDAEGPTVSASDVLGENAYDDLRRGLTEAGLLDAEGRIPEASFAKWWAPIESERERQRESKRRRRMSTGVHMDTPGQTGTTRDTPGPSVLFTSSSPSLPGEGLGVGDRTPGLDLTWNALTGGRVPSDRQLSWMRSMERDYGVDEAIRAMEETYRRTGDPDGLLRDTADELQARRNRAKKREEDDRAARQEQARHDRSERTFRYLREQEEKATTDPRPLAAIMPDVAAALGKQAGGTDDE